MESGGGNEKRPGIFPGPVTAAHGDLISCRHIARISDGVFHSLGVDSSCDLHLACGYVCHDIGGWIERFDGGGDAPCAAAAGHAGKD